MNSIQQWLNSTRPWEVGAALYACHGKDELKKRMFAQGHSDFRQKQLVLALQELLTTADIIPVQLPDKIIEVVVTNPSMPEHRSGAKDDPYKDKWMPLYQEMNQLRHRLRGAASVTERGKMAHRILDLEDECHKYWDMRDYYQRTGAMMPDEEDNGSIRVTNDVNALQKRVNTVRTYITKYAAKLEVEAYDVKAKDKLDKYTRERDNLEKLLGYERTPGKCDSPA